MAAGTATKRERLADVVAIIGMEAERAGQLAAAAQTLAKRIAGGYRATLDEKRIFSLVNWDKARIDKEVSRWGTVLDWQAKAGTAESRAAAVVEMEASKKAESNDGPRLDAEIGRLQRERAALAVRVRTAAAAVDGHAQACRVLRELVPEEERRDFNERRHELNAKYIELPQVETEVGVIRQLRTLDAEERKHHAQARQRDGVQLIDRTERRYFRCDEQRVREAIAKYGSREAALLAEGSCEITEKINETRWSQYLAEREAALPQLEQRLAELRAAKAAELAKIEAALDGLIPQ